MEHLRRPLAVCRTVLKNRIVVPPISDFGVVSPDGLVTGRHLGRYTAFAEGGADILIDAVGIAPLTEQTIDLAAPGARIAVIGFDEHAMQIPPVKLTKKELTLVGSRMNNGMFPKVIEWMENNCLDLSGMVSGIYPVEDIQRAFSETLESSDSNVKTIITF